MKILLVNYEYPGITANCGGGGEVTRQLAQQLTARGHTVEVFTDTHDRHHTTFPLRTYHTLKQTLQEFQPDVINGHFSLPSSIHLPLAAGGTPVVVSVMGADVYDPTRYHHLRPLMALANRYLARSAAGVVAPSRDLQQRFTQQTGHQPQRIPYGIDPSDWRWTTRDLAGPVRILSVCRLVERKNLRAGIRAVSRLQPQGSRVEYRIVGTGPMRERLQDEFGDRKWLSLPGYVDNLQAEFDTADVFFLPSQHEAFGMVFLEALAAGLPVVTSSVGGQTDIVSDAVGATAPPDQPEQLGDALQTVLDDYTSYQRATEGYVDEHFHVDQMADEYVATYREAINA